jgi:hypothetical protein
MFMPAQFAGRAGDAGKLLAELLTERADPSFDLAGGLPG